MFTKLELWHLNLTFLQLAFRRFRVKMVNRFDCILDNVSQSTIHIFCHVFSTDIAINWSDHGLWWPDRNVWLTRTRSTLDQCDVQADARLWFTPMHKLLNVQLPDLQEMPMRVNFSVNVFSVVIKLCKELSKSASHLLCTSSIFSCDQNFFGV